MKQNINRDRRAFLCNSIPILISWLLPVAILFCSGKVPPVWPTPVKYLFLLLWFFTLVVFKLFYFHLSKKSQDSFYPYWLLAADSFALTQYALFGDLSNWLLPSLVCLVFVGMTIAFGLVSKRETGSFLGYNELLIYCLCFELSAILFVIEQNISFLA